MPSFNNTAIFGIGVVMPTGDDERGRQVNEYPGRHGVEVVDLGSRGRTTEVSGTHVEFSVAGLIFVQGVFRSYRDGIAYTLVDTAGRIWPGVLCERFNPTGAIMRGNNTYIQPYRATFRHLI